MATNMYRVGDYVYVETSPNTPFFIRRIEELNKNPSGTVEAKVMCFYRRRDLPNPLVQLADKHQLMPLNTDKFSLYGADEKAIIAKTGTKLSEML